MANNFVKSFFKVTSISIITRVVSFIFHIYLTRIFGALNIGIYSIASSVLNRIERREDSAMQYIHKVKKEESVRDICVKYSVCEEELLSANNLAEEDIKEGVLLFVSVPDGRRYVVKPFDTIRKIAEKFEVSEAAILAFNNIKQLLSAQPFHFWAR